VIPGYGVDKTLSQKKKKKKEGKRWRSYKVLPLSEKVNDLKRQ
jgi:hypothetical protein